MSESQGGGSDTKSDYDSENTAGKLFIGGLSWQTTEDGLRYYFEKYGELTDVALMTDKRTMQPRGFGFVSFKDPAALDVVLGQTHNIDGRVVDVKRAVPRDKAPAPSRQESRKIFVGGLAPEVGDKEFSEYFGKFGPLQDSIVMYDRKTNRSRGFGFVTFENEEDVRTVLRQEHEIMGKWVELKRAEPREANRPMDMTMTLGGRAALYAAGRGPGGGGGSGGRGGGGGGRYDEYGGYGPYMGGMHMNPAVRGAGSGAAFGYRGGPYAGDAYGGRGVAPGGPYGGYAYGPTPGSMGGYYSAGYSSYGPPSVGPYGAGGPMGKGMEDPAYGMANDYSRAGAPPAAAAAGYGAVPPSAGMRPAGGMEGAPPQMGLPSNPGMYNPTMSAAAAAAGYGGYGMNGAPMYQQPPPQGTAGSSQGPRMGSDGGYGDSGYGVPAGSAGGNSNYGNRSQGSATTQARVDRSYRPY
mmetsp:Transcript_13827/g.14412  ORF Transcript_13827/g.14412 Transcript_13827/m.14412 type:complete len:465 (+) Transcript_13827:164-1558(+)